MSDFAAFCAAEYFCCFMSLFMASIFFGAAKVFITNTTRKQIKTKSIKLTAITIIRFSIYQIQVCFNLYERIRNIEFFADNLENIFRLMP